MKVYVVESGDYEQRGIDAIYDSAERAMAAYPGKWTHTIREEGWEWWSGPDGRDIVAYELIADGSVAEPVPARSQ